MSNTTDDDGPALEDLAAELDHPDNDPAGDDAGADPAAPRPRFFAGYVDDGPPPYPGKLLVSRFPRGVLLIDMGRRRAWLLDFDAAGGLYRCRNTAGMAVDDERRWAAADGGEYEVRAYDPDFAGDEAPSTEQCPEPGCDDDAGGAA